MANLLNAYCEELDRVVTIEEAIEHYFAEPDPSRRIKLTFFCSDEICRAKVKGVNYYNEAYIKAPHFSRISAHPHHEQCIWSYFEEFIEAVKNGEVPVNELGESNLFRQYRRDVAADIIDAYIPLAEIDPEGERRVQAPNRQNMRQWARTYEHKTSLFGKLVRAYLELTNQERDHTQVRIPTGNGLEHISYSRAFVPVSEIIIDQPQRVFFGQARIYKYSGDNYKIIFRDYNRNMERYLSPVAIINMSDLGKNTPFENRLKVSLDTFSQNKAQCHCYILGNAAQGEAELKKGEQNPCLLLTPLSLREIEISKN